jgi:hypothetical protein
MAGSFRDRTDPTFDDLGRRESLPDLVRLRAFGEIGNGYGRGPGEPLFLGKTTDSCATGPVHPLFRFTDGEVL